MSVGLGLGRDRAGDRVGVRAPGVGAEDRAKGRTKDRALEDGAEGRAGMGRLKNVMGGARKAAPADGAGRAGDMALGVGWG